MSSSCAHCYPSLTCAWWAILCLACCPWRARRPRTSSSSTMACRLCRFGWNGRSEWQHPCNARQNAAANGQHKTGSDSMCVVSHEPDVVFLHLIQKIWFCT
eukprot:scaffold5264_cov19-Tisochrysis_lutea.AAC.3